jgi:hypothetical protein
MRSTTKASMAIAAQSAAAMSSLRIVFEVISLGLERYIARLLVKQPHTWPWVFSGPSRKRLGEDVFYSAQDESSGPTSRAIREHQLASPIVPVNLRVNRLPTLVEL